MVMNEKQFRNWKGVPMVPGETVPPPEKEPEADHRTREWAEQEYDASGGGLFYAKGRK